MSSSNGFSTFQLFSVCLLLLPFCLTCLVRFEVTLKVYFFTYKHY